MCTYKYKEYIFENCRVQITYLKGDFYLLKICYEFLHVYGVSNFVAFGFYFQDIMMFVLLVMSILL
jgi:hypothetical protein